MANIVTPKTFMIGYTTADEAQLTAYCDYTDQADFMKSWREAKANGVSDGEALCSFYAKLCYKSLVLGKNDNLSRIRDISDNITSTRNVGHYSVFRHCNLNFVTTDCSRIYTHEHVRHNAGFAYSQTSGRYCRSDEISVVLDPITEVINDEMLREVAGMEKSYARRCDRMGLNGTAGLFRVAFDQAIEEHVSPSAEGFPSKDELRNLVVSWANELGMRADYTKPDVHGIHEYVHDFDRKKKITSALRRMLPNAQANEMGTTVNLQALRHYVQLRSAPGAEWEIRLATNQIFDLVQAKFPYIFADAKFREVDGQRAIYGMRVQPYELHPDDPASLEVVSTEMLKKELDRRAALQQV